MEKVTVKDIWKNLIKMLGFLIAGIVVGYFLLVLVYSLPIEPMQKNVLRSEAVFVSEEEYRRVIPGYISTQLDNYTDSWMLGNAVFQSDDSVWKQALTCTRAEYGEGPRGSLIQYLKQESGYQEQNYTRYWHGYLVILKPLLLFFSYADIRFINMIAELFLCLWVCHEFYKKGYRKECLAYLISLLFIMPIVIPLSIQFSVIFYISQIGMLVLLRKYEWLCRHKSIFIYFQLLGMITSYCDLLTYPIATLGMSMVCLMLLEDATGFIEKIKKIILYSVSWGVGYGVMWAGKWILSTVVLGDNVIQNALSQILLRSSMEQDGDKLTVFEVWLRNVEFYFEKPYLFIIGGCLIGTIVWLVYNKVSFKKLCEQGIPFLVISAMPFVWYAFAGQHSYEHHWFTFRGLMVTVFACLCIGIRTCCKKE